MCPVVLLAVLFGFLLLLLEITAAIHVTFNPSSIYKLKEGEHREVSFSINDTSSQLDLQLATIYSEKPDIVDVDQNSTWYFNNTNLPSDGIWSGLFTVKGNFLGFSDIRVKTRALNTTASKSVPVEEVSETKLPISVVRPNSKLQTVFIVSVAILVSVNYINMGCALDMTVVKSVLVKPIAPLLGFACQSIIMPLVAFGVGYYMFNADQNLQLGLFTFGCSPGGGASNMWTVLLGGNLNLSITLTFISNAVSLLMMPFWLFTLGSSLFKGPLSKLPFGNIVGSLVSMVVPLGVGLLIQRYLPKTAKFCRKIIAPASIVMILYIVVFATVTNLYMFKILNWRILVASSLNVWIGFLAGVILGYLFRLEGQDIIAIAIETGVQNTGISIVLLGVSLTQPSADLASVVPVAASIVTPIPLLVALVVKKIKTCYDKKHRYALPNDDVGKMVTTPSDLSSYNGDPKSHYFNGGITAYAQ